MDAFLCEREGNMIEKKLTLSAQQAAILKADLIVGTLKLLVNHKIALLI